MKIQKFCLLIFLLLSIYQISFGQNSEDYQPQDNWLSQYHIQSGSYLYHRYDKYSQQDVSLAKKKLETFYKNYFQNKLPQNEWEGKYYSNLSETSFSHLYWNSKDGFLEYNIYTCLPELRRLKVGTVKNFADAVEFISSSSKDLSFDELKPTKFIKVKWGKMHYLIEENSLKEFYEKAVGIYVDPDLTANETGEYVQPKWTNFWEDNGEIDINSLPILPKGYEKHKRFPIKTKIISIGTRTIEKDKQLGNTTYSEGAFLEVGIGAGKSSGVKIGMIFELSEAKHLIEITKVQENKAIGIIYRDIDENQKDICRDENFVSIPCPKISVGLKAQTQIGILQY